MPESQDKKILILLWAGDEQMLGNCSVSSNEIC